MPCNRSPPRAMAVLEVPPSSSLLHHSSSEPSLTVKNATSSSSIDELTSNASRFRNAKRKLIDNDDDRLEVFMTEMRTMFSEFKNEENIKYEKIFSAVEEIRLAVEFSSKRCETLETKVNQLELRQQESSQHVKLLEDRLDFFERSSRSTCLEIRNIPTSQAESKTSLASTFLKTAKALNVDIQPAELKDVFRIKSKDPAARTIIVDLTSVLLKEKVIAMFKKFNRGGSRFTTEHLHIAGPAKPVFISENLSNKMKRLFFLAREFAKENQYRFCWVTNGNIFLRKKEGALLIRVTCEADLAKSISKE